MTNDMPYRTKTFRTVTKFFIKVVKMTPDGKLYPNQKNHNGAQSTLVC